MKDFTVKLIEKVGGMDKVAHFFGGATIALSVTLILCFVGSINKVIPYSIIGTNAAVIFAIVKELFDSEFNKDDILATMLGGIISIVISLISLLCI